MTHRSYSHKAFADVKSAQQVPPPEVTSIDLARMAGIMEAKQNPRRRNSRPERRQS